MAGLFEGVAPPDISKTTQTKAEMPGFLSDYLSNLAQSGTEALGTVKPAVKDASGNIITPSSFVPKTATELIGDRPEYYANLISNIDPITGKPKTGQSLPGLSDLTRYQTALDAAKTAGQAAAGSIGLTYDEKGNPIFSDALKAFYDPFQKEVIGGLREASDENLRRRVLPALKALGVSAGAGSGGSSRTYDISGQTLADLESALSREESGLRSKGFKDALDAALKQQQTQASAASALSSIGTAESVGATGALKSLTDLGKQQLEYNQAKIEAPLTRAKNVAEIMRGYTYPTTTTETYKGPGTVYGPSVFQQVAGLSSLIGSMFPAGGQGIGNRAIKSVKDYIQQQQDKNLAINMADIDRIVSESGSGGTMASQELEDFFNSILGTDSGGWLGDYIDQSSTPAED